jgi:hypothetical protein
VTITFKVFASDNKKFQTFRVPANDGEENTAVVHMFNLLNEQWPDMDWTFVRTGRKQYNVLHKVGQA